MPKLIEEMFDVLNKKVDGMCSQFTAVQQEIKGLRDEMKIMTDNVMSTLRAEIGMVDKKLQDNINDLRSKIQDMEVDVNASVHHMEAIQKEEMANVEKALKGQIEELKEISDGQEREIMQLQQDSEEQEQYSRRNAIRILGLKESKGERCDQLALEVFNVMMGLSIREDMIDRSHRVGHQTRHNGMDTGTQGARKRPIILKFTSYRYKRLVMKAKKELKGKGVMVVEDLTRHRAILVRKALDNPRVAATWTSDGRVLIKRKDNDRIMHIKCARDLPAAG